MGTIYLRVSNIVSTKVGNSLVVHNVEFRFGEGWGDLVFHNLQSGTVTPNPTCRVLNLPNPAYIHAYRGKEFKSAAPRLCLRATKHHADLLPYLIGKEHYAVRLINRTGQPTHGAV